MDDDKSNLGPALGDLDELKAMSEIVTALAPLPDEMRQRILRWTNEKYGVQITPVRRATGAGAGTALGDSGDDTVEDELAATEPEFIDFGDLFAAADPRSNEDKALVAAYWRQVHENEEKWQASALQKDLRNLGHAIPNITDALTSNIRKRPQRVIQVQKAGSSKQARKTYKVTREGLLYVKAMLDSVTE